MSTLRLALSLIMTAGHNQDIVIKLSTIQEILRSLRKQFPTRILPRRQRVVAKQRQSKAA